VKKKKRNIAGKTFIRSALATGSRKAREYTYEQRGGKRGELEKMEGGFRQEFYTHLRRARRKQIHGGRGKGENKPIICSVVKSSSW